MSDGVYQVVQPKFVAAFIVSNGRVVVCAPILRKRIEYWKTVALKIS